eukprot:COSAG03_NODE_9587_length_708_cov_1.384236_2_plen_121_part_00
MYYSRHFWCRTWESTAGDITYMSRHDDKVSRHRAPSAISKTYGNKTHLVKHLHHLAGKAATWGAGTPPIVSTPGRRIAIAMRWMPSGSYREWSAVAPYHARGCRCGACLEWAYVFDATLL